MSSTRHKSRRTLCQGRTVRACVHSVGMLCGYMPNSIVQFCSGQFDAHFRSFLHCISVLELLTLRPNLLYANDRPNPASHVRLPPADSCHQQTEVRECLSLRCWLLHHIHDPCKANATTTSNKMLNRSGDKMQPCNTMTIVSNQSVRPPSTLTLHSVPW